MVMFIGFFLTTNITGKVKMVAVGYGREAEDGSQTLGGRDAKPVAPRL
jgi:hypothetical protein